MGGGGRGTWGVGKAVVMKGKYLEGGMICALLVFYNEGMTDADVQPEVCRMETQHSVICLCSHTNTISITLTAHVFLFVAKHMHMQ